jgi:hypothetical protein
MRRVAFIALILGMTIVSSSEVAYPCSAVRAGAQLNVFTCPCPPPGGGGNLETQIYVVSGTVTLTNRRSAPDLASIVIELQARENGRYITVARRVLNEAGQSTVNTCNGPFTAGPIDGRVVLTDANGNELQFADVKNLPEGSATINFVATFAGAIPEIDLGERARVRVHTTAIGVDSPRTCEVDADGDGTIDNDVRTLVLQRVVRVPNVAGLLTP